MARNGSLNRKRQIAAKKRAANPVPKHKTIQQGIDYAIKRFADSMQNLMDEGYTFDEAFQRVKAASTLGPASIKKALAMLGYATNPRKKTVSQKISQLVHEGYPQKQAVAIALNEERSGKVKRNPGLYDNINAKRTRIAAGSGERMRRPGTKGAPTDAAFKRSAATARKRNPASGLVPGFAVVCMHPNPHTVAITTSMAEAKKIGQDYATRENVQVAIKPVDVHASHFA
jgi:hypothetical protein